MRRLLIAVMFVWLVVGCGGGDKRADTIATATSMPIGVASSDPDPTSTADSEIEQTTSTIVPSSPTTVVEIVTATSSPTSEPSPTEEASPTATDESAASNENLEASLISLEDLPVGWTTWDRGEDTDEPGLGICDAPSLEEQFDPIADAAVDFQKGELGPFLTQATAKYESTGVAEEVMQHVRATFTCTEWTDINDGVETVWTISPLSFPTIGDDTFVLRMSANAGIATLEFDLVYLRVGSVVTGVGHIGVNSVDSEQTVEFAELAAGKLD